MGGRPRALDDTKRREVCALISAGCDLEWRCTIRRLQSCHHSPRSPAEPRFFEDLRKAELAAQIVPLQAMRKAAGNHWRAAAWLLERTQPNAFGPRRPLHFSVDEVSDAMQIVHDVIQEEVTDRDVSLRLWGGSMPSVPTSKRNVTRLNRRAVMSMAAKSAHSYSVKALPRVRRFFPISGSRSNSNGDNVPRPNRRSRPQPRRVNRRDNAHCPNSRIRLYETKWTSILSLALDALGKTSGFPRDQATKRFPNVARARVSDNSPFAELIG